MKQWLLSAPDQYRVTIPEKKWDYQNLVLGMGIPFVINQGRHRGLNTAHMISPSNTVIFASKKGLFMVRWEYVMGVFQGDIGNTERDL